MKCDLCYEEMVTLFGDKNRNVCYDCGTYVKTIPGTSKYTGMIGFSQELHLYESADEMVEAIKEFNRRDILVNMVWLDRVVFHDVEKQN